MSKASLIPLSSELIKEVKELINWKGKDKTKRSEIIKDNEDGGLKMLDLESMIFAQIIIVQKSTLKITKVPGSTFWNFISRKWVGDFCYNAILKREHHPVTLPVFYRGRLQAWSSMTSIANYD